MATIPTKNRLNAAEGRLDQIEAALGLQPPKPKSAFRQFREHLWQQINLHKSTIIPIVAIVISATIGIGGWFAASSYRYHLDHKDDAFNNSVDKLVDKKLDAEGGINKQLRTMSESLTAIKTTLEDLKPLIRDVINHQFESVSTLPTATLQERLPAIQHLVSIAKDEGVKASPKVLGRLTQKLGAASTSAVGFWPVAADFITYRSETFCDKLSKHF
jgi:hypothetical protein